MTYTIDQTNSATVSLVLMYSAASFQECLIHAMDAWRKAVDLANNGDKEKSASNLNYAEKKANAAIAFATQYSRKRGARSAVIEAEHILHLIDNSRRVAVELAA